MESSLKPLYYTCAQFATYAYLDFHLQFDWIWGMMVHTFNPITREAEDSESL